MEWSTSMFTLVDHGTHFNIEFKCPKCSAYVLHPYHKDKFPAKFGIHCPCCGTYVTVRPSITITWIL